MNNQIIINHDAIKTKAEDFLGRYEFAERIAKAILNKSIPFNSYCIGIEGDWGSGKTSILNLVKSAIEKNKSDNKPIIIEFHPWIFSGQTDITDQFFKAIKSGINENGRWWKKILFFLFSPITFVFNLILELAPGLINFIPVNFLGNYLPFLIPVAALVKTYINSYQQGKANIFKIKNTTKKALEKSKKHFLIIIDDIDRLQINEICTVFQLVKSIADLPNTTYLLAYDRPIIEKSLKLHYKENGKSFLDKIVQTRIATPSFPDYESEKHLNKYIELLSGDNNLPNDIAYFLNNISFSSIRELNNFFSSFEFMYNSLKDEVNFIDLLHLYYLYNFNYALFSILKNNKDIVISNDYEKKNNLINDIAAANSNHNHVSIFGKLVKGAGVGISQENTINNHFYFDRYFTFQIMDNTLTQSEFQNFLKSSESEQFIQFKEICDKNKVHDLFSRIERISAANLEERFVKTFLTTLHRYNDENYKNEKYYPFPIISHIAFLYNNSLYNTTATEYFVSNLDKYKDTSLFLKISNENNNFLKDQTHVKEKLGEKYLKKFENGKLEESNYFYQTLLYAQQFDETRLKNAIITHIQNDDYFIKFMVKNGISCNYKGIHYSYNVSIFDYLLEMETSINRLKELIRSIADENDKQDVVNIIEYLSSEEFKRKWKTDQQ